MSLFLGKIHFWLFDKIKWFESLEDETLRISEKYINNIDDLIEGANENFGERLKDEPLDNLIDQSNIHGWLQDAINSAEGRVAFYTTELLKSKKDAIEELKEAYSKVAEKNAKAYVESNGKPITAGEIYKAMNDYILEGMPCDRINQIEENSDESVKWRATRCLHKEFWNRVSGNVENFYNLRNIWITKFVETLNSEFKYENNNGLMEISR